ncbi:MAG: PadR family transcriptional regulator [Gemmatimonadetes bacterium]|nr:MAG: PadR family transcriptional regulator [Gemmatimonadota bacterium]
MDLIKGTLDVLVLKTLAHGPLHGYGVSRAIRDATGGRLTVEEGALYPALRRLEKAGALSAFWDTTDTGREARFYELTASGRERLERELARWWHYVDAMEAVLGARGGT